MTHYKLVFLYEYDIFCFVWYCELCMSADLYRSVSRVQITTDEGHYEELGWTELHITGVKPYSKRVKPNPDKHTPARLTHNTK